MEEPIVQIDHIGAATVARLLLAELLEDRVILRVEDALLSLAYEEPGRDLVVDFRNVRLVSSSLLGLLIKLKKLVNERGGRMVVCCIRSQVANTPQDRYVYELLKIVRLDTVFDICDTVERSLEKLRARRES